MSESIIKVNHLNKSYGPHHAVKDVSFEVKKGEVVGFLGPNGAGKTTTMKIITGYMAPTSGEVMVGGYDVFANPVEVKKKIGYLPETPPIYSDMYVEDYLKFVASLKGVEAEQIKSYVQNSIEKTHLEGVRHRLIGNLSKGFRQRVGIAQAIVSNPQILILDEPTVGLDPKQVSEIRNLIKELRGDHTIILSTHILPEVQAMCERVIIINDGEIVAEDTLAGLSTRMSGGMRIELKIRRPEESFIELLKQQTGVCEVQQIGNTGTFQIDLEDNQNHIEKLASFVVGKGFGLIGLHHVEVDLEDIFIKLTSNQKSTEVIEEATS